MRQTECPYEVFIRYQKRKGCWIFSESGAHNHEPSIDPSIHAVHRRLQPEELKEVAELATGNSKLRCQQISRLLKGKHQRNISIPKDFSNAIARAKREKLDGLTNVEAAIEQLQKLSKCQLDEAGSAQFGLKILIQLLRLAILIQRK